MANSLPKESIDSGNKTDEVQIRNYELNDERSHNKIKQAALREKVIDYEYKSGEIPIKFKIEVFEKLKENAKIYFKSGGKYKCSLREATDNANKPVELLVKVNKGDSYLYTLHLYYTKFSALVNGKYAKTFIDEDLCDLLPEYVERKPSDNALAVIDSGKTDVKAEHIDGSKADYSSLLEMLGKLLLDVAEMQKKFTEIQTQILDMKKQVEETKAEGESTDASHTVNN